ncbi:MAG: hypothetical protein RIF41_16030 [Polyangiaceae bacterium]
MPPLGFVSLGFGPVESVVVTVAALNIHDFIVDGFIWKLRRDTNNRRIVSGEGEPAPAQQGAAAT